MIGPGLFMATRLVSGRCVIGLFCVGCVFCRLVVLARLSVPVQVIGKTRLMTYVLMGTLNPTHSLTHSLTPSARLGLAIVLLCRGTGAPFDEHRRPLAPSKFFDVCVTEKNSIIAVVPCLRPWS